MNYYISDLHFGHENCIKFDNRPFANADEMYVFVRKRSHPGISSS